jgi:hypothetical protein
MLLYTVGDSFTYGYELENPKKHAWPVLLANRLGYDLSNFGNPGVGNDYIVKTTVNAVFEQKPNLLIVAWTSASRMEFHDENGSHVTWPGHFRKSRLFPYRNQITDYVTQHNNEQLEYQDWLVKIILLQNYLENQLINYRFVNTFDNQIRNVKYKEKSQHYIDQINTDKFIGWPNSGLVEWFYTYPKAAGGHPLEDGHAAIADIIFNSL